MIIGVVWAAIVSRYWWPAEARRELSRALGECVSTLLPSGIDRRLITVHVRFCLNIGWLYTRLVAFNSFSDEEFHLHAFADDTSSTEESPLLRVNPAMTQSIQHFMSM